MSEVEHLKASVLVSALVRRCDTAGAQTHLQGLAKAGIKERE